MMCSTMIGGEERKRFSCLGLRPATRGVSAWESGIPQAQGFWLLVLFFSSPERKTRDGLNGRRRLLIEFLAGAGGCYSRRPRSTPGPGRPRGHRMPSFCAAAADQVKQGEVGEARGSLEASPNE